MSNFRHSPIERKMNTEHRTSNIEHRTPGDDVEAFAAVDHNGKTCRRDFSFRCPMFDVRCSVFLLFLLVCLVGGAHSAEPLRALMITGGCCHDYEAQKKILSEGISARANVTWTIIHEGGNDSKDTKFSIYNKPDWAKGFDVVVHNECSGFAPNVVWVEHIARAHYDGVPAVVIHCSIHSYRNSTTDEWRKVLGVSSYRHQARRPFEVIALKPDHPVLKGFPAKWQDGPDELYEIKTVWPTCVPLAESITPNKPDDKHVSIWLNTCGKGRVFGTTPGHLDETMQRP